MSASGEIPRSGPTRSLGRRLAQPFLGEGGDLFGEPFGIDDTRIEVVGDPLFELGVTFVFWIADRLKKFGVAPGTADVFRRAAAGGLDQPRIGDARLGVAEALDLDRVLPAVAEVV